MQKSKGLSAHLSTIATIIGNCGAVRVSCTPGLGRVGTNFICLSPYSLFRSLEAPLPATSPNSSVAVSPSLYSVSGKLVFSSDCWLSRLRNGDPTILRHFGRSRSLTAFSYRTCAFIPLWLLPNSFGGLAAGAFFVQFGVQGAWGVIPIYLTEISPVAYRSVFPGLAYVSIFRVFTPLLSLSRTMLIRHDHDQQLGNMVSSSAAQIESVAGDHIKTKAGNPDYGKIGAILICVRPERSWRSGLMLTPGILFPFPLSHQVVAGWIIGCCLIGAEQHGSHFEKGKVAYEVGAGRDEIEEREFLSFCASLGFPPLLMLSLPSHASQYRLL